MKYAPLYKVILIPPVLIRTLAEHVEARAAEPTQTLDSDGVTRRSGGVVWVKHPPLIGQFLEIAKDVNRQLGWDFDVDVLEPLQYTTYREGDEYGWHTDQHATIYPDGRVRKFSFSVFLNDDFEGGAFDLEVYAPNADPRFVTFERMRPNTALFFQADLWHRVRPVTRGVRRSLVGWVLGPRFR